MAVGKNIFNIQNNPPKKWLEKPHQAGTEMAVGCRATSPKASVSVERNGCVCRDDDDSDDDDDDNSDNGDEIRASLARDAVSIERIAYLYFWFLVSYHT